MLLSGCASPPTPEEMETSRQRVYEFTNSKDEAMYRLSELLTSRVAFKDYSAQSYDEKQKGPLGLEPRKLKYKIKGINTYGIIFTSYEYGFKGNYYYEEPFRSESVPFQKSAIDFSVGSAMIRMGPYLFSAANRKKTIDAYHFLMYLSENN